MNALILNFKMVNIDKYTPYKQKLFQLSKIFISEKGPESKRFKKHCMRPLKNKSWSMDGLESKNDSGVRLF